MWSDEDYSRSSTSSPVGGGGGGAESDSSGSWEMITPRELKQAAAKARAANK